MTIKVDLDHDLQFGHTPLLYRYTAYIFNIYKYIIILPTFALT